MSSGRGSGGGGAAAGGGSAAIPNTARKLVQTIKEIVAGNSDDDIYSMLKECNMDLDQTVQRLLNQDPFHEVKRKRDKKKEAATRENTEARVRSPSIGISSRGGRSSGSLDRNVGRGNSLPRYGSNEFSGGRGKVFIAKENGIHPSGRTSTVSVDSAPTAGAAGGLKSSPRIPSSVPETIGTSFVSQNNGATHAHNVSGPQLRWVAAGSGNATMAEILKANGPHPPALPANDTVNIAPLPLSTPSLMQSPISSSGLSVSGVYSSLSDPVLQRPLDLRISGSPGAIKKGVGTVGNQRPVGDRAPISYSSDGNSASSSLLQAQISSGTIIGPPIGGHDVELHKEHSNLSVPPSGPLTQSITASLPLADISSSIEDQSLETGVPAVSDSPPSRTGIISNQFSNRQLYQPQQPPVGTQKSSGAGLEWKPKSIGQGSIGITGPIGTSSAIAAADSLKSPPSSAPAESIALSSATSKFQGLSMHDDQPVIMPNHLQISEADRTHLSFGSFEAGFGSSFSTNFGSDERSRSPVKETSIAAEPSAVEKLSSSMVTSAAVPLSQSYIQHQETSVQVENSSSITEVAAVSLAGPVVSQSEVSRPGPIVQQGPPYPYLPTVPNYPGFGLIPQIQGGQFAFEPSESLAADVPRLSSLMQPYTDPTTSYYTPTFRPVSDTDSRYPSFLSSKAIGKYNGNVAPVTGQSLPSQESGSSMAPSSTGPASQTSPTSSVQAVPTMPQQPLPIHAYAAHHASVPLGHYTNVFGYQYVPPSYPYLHTPYQHNFAGSGGYPQPPAGSNYPSPGNTYPLGTGLAVKYPLTQYKSGSGTVNTHAASAAGFGAYTTAPSGYAGNPTVTIGTASGYEEVGGPQYKESNLYIPSQQAEGSTIWVQTQLSRDIAAAGMQASSYYNLPGQGQHSPYAHAQQHAHALPAGTYANLYHASQSAPTPSAHQMLQQQQTLGTGGAGGAQGGAYQQARVQQNWGNNY
ncbi:hypothetical protein O6H91_07G091400 [Diphasiastrum complanatum]|uniref:Uncharacterized protein n=1 Tax=Diphasiastrum complanatum TaxID=34168 RepID=A0ACC2D7X1_DIPCM|nr:hypothetical protein O6H91_07G091400 [Diphasiastrum complanatum]